MLSRSEVVPKRLVLSLFALALALCLLGANAVAQVTIQPKAEVFGGYSWYHPEGLVDWGHPKDITHGFDASAVYYLPSVHNFGILVDGSGHFDSTNADVGFGLAGVQYKFHSDQFSPFLRAFVGASHISPAGLDSQWRPAAGGGGGFDLNLTHMFAIRLFQADYIFTNYRHNQFNSPVGMRDNRWDSVRLAGGIVINLGNYTTAPVSAACSASPAEVTEGDQVKVTATGTNFNPKHTQSYSWKTSGGKVTGDGSTATIDTTGLAAGSYTASATISDNKSKKDVANCSANFTVKEKPKNPPQVSCSANPSTVKAGDPSTITTSATSPDNSQITSYAYQASAGRISGTGTTATLDTTGAPSGPISVTCSATDARNLTGSGSTTVNVETPPPPPQASKINEVAFPDKRRPWRVDNTAKAILDDVANRLKSDPNAKVSIVGYADGEKAPRVGTGKRAKKLDLAAQRAVNAKAYLVQQQGIDPSRIDVRTGTGQQKKADIIWIPQGATYTGEGTTAVDETKVKPSAQAYPKPRAAATHHRRHAAKKPAAQ